MNKYAIIILIALVSDYLLGLVADRLNLKNQTAIPPAEFSDLIDEKSYRKNRDYLRANTVLAQYSSAVSLTATLVFSNGSFYGWISKFGPQCDMRGARLLAAFLIR